MHGFPWRRTESEIISTGFPGSAAPLVESPKLVHVAVPSAFMTKQSWTLLVVAVALGALYLLGFTDLGRAQQIQINVSSRPFAPNAAPDDVLPIIFGLD